MEDRIENTEPGEWPLWRIALKAMRELPTFGYGMTLETEWFEKMLAARRDTSCFAFQMMELRQELEAIDGYYLYSQTIQDEETTIRREMWKIPSASDHEGVAKGFEGKMRRYAGRAVLLRVKTLNNDKALLSDSDRTKMDSSARIAATRLVLLRREKAISAYVRRTQPKMLECAKA